MAQLVVGLIRKVFHPPEPLLISLHSKSFFAATTPRLARVIILIDSDSASPYLIWYNVFNKRGL